MPVKLTAETIASTNVRRFTLEFLNVDYGTALVLLDPFEKAEVESCLQPESTVHEKLIALEIMARRLYEKELVRPPVRTGWQRLAATVGLRLHGSDGSVRIAGGGGAATVAGTSPFPPEARDRVAALNAEQAQAHALALAQHNRDAERIQRMNRLHGMMAGDITRPTDQESVRRQDRHIAELAELAARRVEVEQEALGREGITLLASEADFLGELYVQFHRCAMNEDQHGVANAGRAADTTIARIRSDRSARDSTRFRRSHWVADDLPSSVAGVDAPSLEQQVGGDSPPAPSEPVVSVAVSVPPPVVDPRPGIRAAIEAQAEYDADEELARQEAETRSRLRAERRSTIHDRAEAYLNSRGRSLQTVSAGVRLLILDRARRGTLPPHPREST